MSRRHVLHFRWDLCFIRIAYHEAPVWSEQSHRSKVVMNPRKITPFKTWKKSQEKYQVPRRHVLQFRWDLCIIRISYHIAPVPSNHTVQNLNWIQEKSYCSKLDIKAKKMSYQIIKKYSLIFFFRWDLCLSCIAYHEAPVLSYHTIQNLKWIQKNTSFKIWNKSVEKCHLRLWKTNLLIFYFLFSMRYMLYLHRLPKSSSSELTAITPFKT